MNTEISTVPLPAAFRQKRVLLVEDEALIRMWLADELSEAGLDVLEAEDGDHAVALIDELTSVDLLITDIGLPGGLNGRQVAEAARKFRGDLKVLFITGYAENAVLSHGHIDSGMHVMTKPFSMEGLATRIRSMLD